MTTDQQESKEMAFAMSNLDSIGKELDRLQRSEKVAIRGLESIRNTNITCSHSAIAAATLEIIKAIKLEGKEQPCTTTN